MNTLDLKKMDIGMAIPILPSRDLVETRAFYERLGFETGYWATGPDGYAILGRGDLRMHFFTHAELVPSESYSGCYWKVLDADALHREFRALKLPSKGFPSLQDIGDKPWGMREFSIIDPNGNLVRIGHDVERRG